MMGLTDMAHDLIGNENRKLFSEMGAPAVRAKADSGDFDVSQLIAAQLWLAENEKKFATLALCLSIGALALAALGWFLAFYKIS